MIARFLQQYILFALLGQLALSAGPSLGSSVTLSSTPAWEMRWGDFTPEPGGAFPWEEIESDNDWQSTSSLMLPRHKGHAFLWLRLPLTEALTQDGSMMRIAYVNQSLEVFADTGRIFHFGSLDSKDTSFQGYRWFIIRIPANLKGEYVYFRVRSTHTNIGLSGVMFGTEESIISAFMLADVPSIGVIFISVMLGIIALAIALFMHGGKDYLAFAGSLFFFSLFLLGRSGLAHAIVVAPVGWAYVHFFGLYIFAACFISLFLCLFGKSSWQLIRVSSWLLWAYAPGAAIVVATGRVPLVETLMPFQLLVSIVALAVVSCALLLAKQGNPDARIFAIGFSLSTAIATLSILQAIRLIPIEVNLTPLVALALILSLATVFVRRVREVYHLQQQHAHELAEKNAALARLDQLKDQFLANTSHELRTPLHGIVGISESLLDGVAGELPAPARENLMLIAGSGRRLMNLVNDILDFSKLKHSALEIRWGTVSLRQVVDVVLTLSKPLAERNSLTLENRIPEDMPLAAGDENRLQQVFHNLIGNAIKFSEHGTIRVMGGYETDRLWVAVEDQGIGISPENLETIFNSFEQGDGTTSRNYGGTGLGLAVTRELVHLHQGAIQVESKVGVGSRFTIFLPAANTSALPEGKVNYPLPRFVADGEGLLPPSISSSFEPASCQFSAQVQEDADKQPEAVQKDIVLTESRSRSSKSRFHILIVDDEPVNLQVLRNHLSLEGYELTHANDGAQALHLIEEQGAPDLLLLDVMMPKLTGFEVCSRLREVYSQSQLPIILLTAKIQASDIVEGLSSGANDYITKPFHKSELLARVHNQIELSEAALVLADKARLEVELEVAQAVQHSLLRRTKDIPGVEISTRYQPAAKIGGDWFRYRYDSETGVFFAFMGDVTGHGIASALMTGVVSGAVCMFEQLLQGKTSYFGKESSPDQVLLRLAKYLNRVVFEEGGQTLGMTMGIWALEIDTGRSWIVNAGHVTPYLVRNKKARSIPMVGPLLGNRHNPSYRVKELQLQPGDILFTYTDGLTENYGSDQQALSHRKIRNILQQEGDLDDLVSELFTNLNEICRDVPPNDDVATLALRWLGPSRDRALTKPA